MRDSLTRLLWACIFGTVLLSASDENVPRNYVETIAKNLSESDWNKAIASNFFTMQFDSKSIMHKIGFLPKEFNLSPTQDDEFWNSMSQELAFCGLNRCSFERRVWLYQSVFFLHSNTILDIDNDYQGRAVTILDVVEAVNGLKVRNELKLSVKLIGEINSNQSELPEFRAAGWSIFEIIDQTCSMSSRPPNVYFHESFLIIEGFTSDIVECPNNLPAIDDTLLKSFELLGHGKNERKPRTEKAKKMTWEQLE